MVDRLDHLRRVVCTGLAFAALFGGGAVLALTVFPLVTLLTPSGAKRRERNQWLVHWLFRGYVWTLTRLRVIEVTVRGADRLRAAGGRMIVANHPTLLDVVLLMGLVPRSQCIVKGALWNSPYLGRVVRGTGYIRNDLEPEALLEACRDSIARGDSLIIFPEGTRTIPGEPPRFRRGFANIATMLETEIQLVVITCRPLTLVKGEPWWKVPYRRPRFHVEVGDRLDAREWLGYEYRSLAARKLVRQLEEYYMECSANG
ncbi:lysophospholipid acyltransferase family protein [Azospirillum sp. HJ39]|uniref:lysophospholipid acyltransferase family protein n=1 Tax=Azospirillum sp. HJ39 TaxID=3159496 RepID=UPI0035571052